MSNLARVLYITGLGRSGSTVLERCLASLPSVFPLGEVSLLWPRGIIANELCSCGLAFHACAFWKQVGERAFSGWDLVDVDAIEASRAHVSSVARMALSPLGHWGTRSAATYVAAYSAVYSAAASALPPGSLLIDSSKNPGVAKALAAAGVADFRVLHLVRDPRGVAFSWSKTVERVDSGDPRQRMARFSPVRSTLMWNILNGAAERLEGLAPYARIRYEDFVTDPEATIQSAGRDLEIDELRMWHPDEIRPNEIGIHTVAGNPFRMTRGAFSLRSDDEWVTMLSRQSARQIDILSRGGRTRYGYADSDDIRLRWGPAP